MALFDIVRAHGLLEKAAQAKNPKVASAMSGHPLAKIAATVHVLHQMQTAAATDATLAQNMAEADSTDSVAAAGPLANLLTWIENNWATLEPIIVTVLGWFGIVVPK